MSLFFDMEDNFMDLLTLLTLAVGLSMDAFAVSICKGLAMREKVLGKGVIIGLWFGGFQALMPIIGFLLFAIPTARHPFGIPTRSAISLYVQVVPYGISCNAFHTFI